MTSYARLNLVANGGGAQLYLKAPLVRDSSFPLDPGEDAIAYTTAVGIHVVPLQRIGEVAGDRLTLEPPPSEAVPPAHRPDDATDPSEVDVDVDVDRDADGDAHAGTWAPSNGNPNAER